MKILITTKGNFSRKAIAQMAKEGTTIIEAKNPNDIKIISEASFLDSNILSMSAIKAIADTDSMSANTRFVKEFYNRLVEKEKSKTL